MKKRIILPAVFLMFILISCQKEIDWGTNGGGTNQKLIRIKSSTGATDTTQIDYTYDASGRLIKEKTTGIGGGIDLGNELVISRNASGIITKTVQKAAALIATGIDSIVTRVYYNVASSRYIAAAFDISIPGFSATDSAVYAYDANGRISGDSHYLQLTGLPIPLPPVLALKNNYTYSANGSNLVTIQQEATTTPGGPLTPVSSQVFTFDIKTNPLIILTEAIVTNRTGLYNANNPVKTVVTNTVSPGNDFTLDITYKYNSQNKPDSSFSTRTPGGALTASKYFYQ